MIKFMTQRFIQVDVQVNWLLNDKSNDASENDVNKREVCIIFLAKVIDWSIEILPAYLWLACFQWSMHLSSSIFIFRCTIFASLV